MRGGLPACLIVSVPRDNTHELIEISGFPGSLLAVNYQGHGRLR